MSQAGYDGAAWPKQNPRPPAFRVKILEFLPKFSSDNYQWVAVMTGYWSAEWLQEGKEARVDILPRSPAPNPRWGRGPG